MMVVALRGKAGKVLSRGELAEAKISRQKGLDGDRSSSPCRPGTISAVIS